MRNAFLVACREYAENLRTKGFWIGILMLPLVLLASFQIPVFLETQAKPSRHFVLVDLSGELAPVIMGALERQYQREVLQFLQAYWGEHARAGATTALPDDTDRGVERFMKSGGVAEWLARLKPELRDGAPAFEPPRRSYQPVPSPVDLEASAGVEEVASALRPWLRGERQVDLAGEPVRLDAAIILPPDVLQGGRAAGDLGAALQYWASNLADKSLRNLAEKAVSEEWQRREYAERGVDPALFRQIEGMRVPVVELNPKKEAGEERVTRAEMIAQWAPVGFVYLLWVAIFSISQMLLNNTIEEKSNRIIEVLLSSVTPSEFVLGKLLGIAAVGLTMVGTWVASALGMVLWKAGGESEFADQLLGLLAGSHLLPAFVIYFIFGYLLYAAVILAIGSVCNTLKEAQNYMAVITMLMMVPLLTMMFIPKDPHGTLATVLSWIPFYTPFVMMNRAAAHPPLFDLVGTMILLIATTAVAFWAAVKIFRVGVLRAGQPPRFRELLRWLRH